MDREVTLMEMLEAREVRAGRQRELLEQEGVDASQVVVVSNGFHLTRVRMLWGRVWEGEYTLSTLAAPSSHVPSRLKMYIREPLALVKSYFFDR